MIRISRPAALAFMMLGTVSSLTSGSIRIIAILLGVATLVAVAFLDISDPLRLTKDIVRQPGPNPFSWLLLSFTVICVQGVWILGVDGLEVNVLARIAPTGLLLLTAWLVAHRGLAIEPQMLRLGIMFYLAAGVVTGLLGTSTTPCRADKCSPIGVLYKGGFAHENAMGMVAVVAVIGLAFLPKAISIANLSRSLAIIPALAAIGIAVLSGARASLIGGIVAAFVLLVAYNFRQLGQLIAIAVPVASGTAALYLISGAQVEDFSGRGRRWVEIVHALDDGAFSLFGNGFTAWADMQHLFAIPTSSHSAYASFLIHGGLLAVVPFIAFLVSSARRADRASAFGILGLIYFLSLQGIMETVWEATTLGDRSWLLIATVLTLPSHNANHSIDLRSHTEREMSYPDRHARVVHARRNRFVV